MYVCDCGERRKLYLEYIEITKKNKFVLYNKLSPCFQNGGVWLCKSETKFI